MSGDSKAGLVGRLLDVIEGDILPLTEAGVRRGNKIFGAAILRKSDRVAGAG
jgi:tRNA(Arg) A34 adenosine deaminase TadA